MAKAMKIEHLKTGRKITHPGGRVVIETLADIDRYVAMMESEREHLRLQIEHMGAERAKCLAVAAPAPIGGPKP